MQYISLTPGKVMDHHSVSSYTWVTNFKYGRIFMA